ncbi:AP2-like ethylene-responsive transcription factor AIL7 [Phalaenopsis equestris]|uniref:AP2-like ethylene-responsive transcription factor AIL7 n=1 Tax=Phalaenopsis equestris TaxID=78828 RepID=UPI0009E35811|nr:AP2-like ethylene-responsive transcription factor AIL7 [Phalaenopsis equestris]
MAPTRNWLSFPSPLVEMLIPDPSYFDGDGELRLLTSEPRAVKLEDFLGGHHSLPLVSDLSVDDALELSSSITDVPISVSFGVPPEDSSSATGNNFLRLADHSADADLALSQLQQRPEAVDSMKLPVGSLVSSQRTSVYRGVTRHRWTGRFEAHLWDNTWRREGQKRKGRQVYLGGYDNEERAARTYDLAALKYWGLAATTNFPVKNYCTEMEEMQSLTKPEFIASLRRKSSGFSRGASIYRGVTRHHQHGRWQARIGRVTGNKDLYLGTFATEEEAAEAYDVAAIKFRGANAVTNFEFSRYNLEAIANSELPIGAKAKRMKLKLQVSNDSQLSIRNPAASLTSTINEEPSAILQNSLQLRCSSKQPALQYCSFVGSEYSDLCDQNLHWLVPNGETIYQINNGDFVQFMHAAASSSR